MSQAPRRPRPTARRAQVAVAASPATRDRSSLDTWLGQVRDGRRELLQRRIRDAVDPDEIASIVRDAATPESVRSLVAPLARELQLLAMDVLKSDRAAIGDYVPPVAREAIDALVGRHDLVPEALVRELFEQKAVHDAIYQVLYDALTQFNTTVNPFFADWGLPSLLRRVPVGGSLIASSIDALRAEFERRLEPEIRRFLAPFSRRATSQLAGLFVARSGDARLVELRRNLVAFFYTQSLSALLDGVDRGASTEIATVVESVLLGLVESDRLAPFLRDAIAGFVERHGNETIGEWLESIGARDERVVERWAELAWPLVAKAVPQ